MDIEYIDWRFYIGISTYCPSTTVEDQLQWVLSFCRLWDFSSGTSTASKRQWRTCLTSVHCKVLSSTLITLWVPLFIV